MEYKTMHKIRDGMIAKLDFHYSAANPIQIYQGSYGSSYNDKSYYRR